MYKPRLVMVLIFLLTACSRYPTPEPTKPVITPTQLTIASIAPTATRALVTPAPSNTPMVTPTQIAGGIPRLQKGETFSIEKLEMITEGSGWGIARSTDQNDHIMVTGDGGQYWMDVTPPVAIPKSTDQPIRSQTYFFDQQNAWATFYPENEPPLAPPPVWYTHDGGNTWSVSQPIAASPTTELYSPVFLYFIDRQSGWLMLGHGAAAGSAPVSIYQTLDGGNTWAHTLEMLSPQSGSIDTCCQSGMLFFDKKHGVITTSYGPDPFAHVHWSQDGGRSWQRQDLPAPDGVGQDASCGTLSPRITGQQSLFLIMECQVPNPSKAGRLNYLYRTDNFGETWENFPLPVPDIELGGWHYNRRDRQIQFINPENGWFFIHDFYESGDGQETQTYTHIYQTTDGGNTWQPRGKVFWDGSFSFLDDLQGWAVARQGKEIALVVTKNGGITWQIIKPGIKE